MFSNTIDARSLRMCFFYDDVGDFRRDHEDLKNQIPGLGPGQDANARTVVAPFGCGPSRDGPLDLRQQAPSRNPNCLDKRV